MSWIGTSELSLSLSPNRNFLSAGRFLMDLQNTATLSAGDKVKVGLAGLTTLSVAGMFNRTLSLNVIADLVPQDLASLKRSKPG